MDWQRYETFCHQAISSTIVTNVPAPDNLLKLLCHLQCFFSWTNIKLEATSTHRTSQTQGLFFKIQLRHIDKLKLTELLVLIE